MIEEILPHLEKGDIIIDGGNSHWPDSSRRTKYLAEKGLLFTSGPAYPEARKARVMGPPSCRAAIPPRGRM
jgi:6-phosphogluconate dehydrogenase